MAAFFVGQRVRIVGAFDYPELIGQEGTVKATAAPFVTRSTGRPGIGVHVALDCGRYLAYLPEWLEPLTPEGWQVTEWSKCLWQPEGIAA